MKESCSEPASGRTAHEGEATYDPESFKALFAELAQEVDSMAKPFWDEKRREAYPVTTYSRRDRRLIVRSVFSYLEGMIFQLKQLALIFEAQTPGLLLPEEIAMAKEMDYELTESGEIKPIKAKLRFKGNFRFAFKLFTKSNGLNEIPDLGGHEWQGLEKAIVVRDRLTHPKSASDLNVTDEEMQKVLRAYQWVSGEIFVLVARALQKSLRDNPLHKREAKGKTPAP